MAELFLTSEALFFLLREGEDVLLVYRGKVRRVVGFHGSGSLQLEALAPKESQR